jgi:hypothetical protein
LITRDHPIDRPLSFEFRAITLETQGADAIGRRIRLPARRTRDPRTAAFKLATGNVTHSRRRVVAQRQPAPV